MVTIKTIATWRSRAALKSTALGLAVVALLALPVAAAAQPQSADNAQVFTRHACAATPSPDRAGCHAHVRVDAQGVDVDGVTVSGLGADTLRSAYRITGTGSAATTVAVVVAHHYRGAEQDLAVYRAQFGLPPCTKDSGCLTQVDQRGKRRHPATTDLGWNQEAALDLDMVSAMCPNCSLLLVEADSDSFADLAAAVETAAKWPGVRAISNSYGGSEAGTEMYAEAYKHPGIAVVASAGNQGYGVQFPASLPHVVAVGGTRLTADGSERGWSESVWSGTGSGCSAVYAKPRWQRDTECAGRTVADVAAVASPASGVAVYAPKSRGSGWLIFGGTSVSAPLIAGIYGVNGVSPIRAGRGLYRQADALFDVTTGSNGISCGDSYLCNAAVGYDGPSGVGTPNGDSAF